MINSQFNDFDDFTETVNDWSLEFHQLSPGLFAGDLFRMQIDNVHLSYARLNSHLLQEGESPKGCRTIVIPATAEQDFLWRRHHIAGEKIMLFPESRELHAVSNDDFQVFTISVPEHLLRRYVQLIHGNGIMSQLRNTEIFACTDMFALAQLRMLLFSLKENVLADRSLAVNPLFLQDLEGELLLHLVNVLVGASKEENQTFLPKKRSRSMQKAFEYIHEFGHEPIKVRDLCRVSGVSVRTLNYGFYDVFGVSPKSYLVAHRLNGVRKELRSADPLDINISDVANTWGFWHMGQFAADYRKLFGELPSETLKKQ